MTRLFEQPHADNVLELCEHGFDTTKWTCGSNTPRARGHDMSGQPGSIIEYNKKAAKLRPLLLPHEAVLEGIKAMEFGAAKYGPDQWRDVDMVPGDFLNALERHLLAYKSGEKLAEDSKVSHLGHIIANCAILLVKFDQKETK